MTTQREELRMRHELLTQSLEDRLKMLKGVPIFDVPLIGPTGRPLGNNGDTLIRRGAERLFQRHDLTFVDNPERAKVLLMCGSGGMLESYRYLPALFRECWSRYPDKPLMMLPSSYYFPSRSFTADFPPRSAEVTLFCRERVSYEHLVNECRLPSCCEVVLSHDTAFALEDSPLVARYRQTTGKHILIVERDDAEHPGRFTATGGHRKLLRQRIPVALKKPFYPLRAFLFSKRSTPFRDRCEQIVKQNHADKLGLKRLVRDVSRTDYDSFDGFCQAIGDAEIVFASRLHVAIFAALLGKRTYLFAGPYHKIRAIYEHSMAGYDNVTLITGNGS
jgi:exopolysaccharide biosynthesis predicted pyruvyltransferase EpsI